MKIEWWVAGSWRKTCDSQNFRNIGSGSAGSITWCHCCWHFVHPSERWSHVTVTHIHAYRNRSRSVMSSSFLEIVAKYMWRWGKKNGWDKLTRTLPEAFKSVRGGKLQEVGGNRKKCSKYIACGIFYHFHFRRTKARLEMMFFASFRKKSCMFTVGLNN